MPKRTTEQTRALAAEFRLYEYVWPGLCGGDRKKWEQAAEFIDRAALHHHKHHCPGLMADGVTRARVPAFRGDHQEEHRSAVARQFVIFADAGIPRWMREES